MDVRRDTCCSVGNRRRRDSWASSCSERCEDEDRRDQGVAMTIVTLNAILDDNNRMFEFLRSFGVLGDKYICAKCRKLMSCAKVPPKRCRDLLMWRCRKDDVWRSVRKGTWFETARLSIRTIVLMSYCFCMRKSVVSTSRMTGLSERSVGDWFLSCREICSALLKKRGKIGGPGVVVEMGESCFGVAENRKGKWLPELWVWGAVVCGKERGDLVLKIVDKRDARTLQRLLEEHVEDGTVICSDMWKSYEDEGAVDLQTFADDHNYQFRNKVIGTMEQCWEEVKRVLGRGKRRRSGLQSHLDEYVWRESVFGNGCVFHSFMRGVGTVYVPCVEDPTPVTEHPKLSARAMTTAEGKGCPTQSSEDPSSPMAARDSTPVTVERYPSLSAIGPSSTVAPAMNFTVQPKETPTKRRKCVV
ncbi:uncharacterized protein LOC124720341 [Schistocerca piceifrons]|uniref:uncharacterized protein LOC124720341 n=1 Tax=Schistocerca piceifrons TaxID=274613 RepID=UPI001F5FA9B6|nr:uncharacterized protein LOC124720341 [Schistocerca piceifrons]XP_047101619.1 uncharacterized protein LOC124720341 [Schistocerca piceifrons]XP_047101620.1 uncharacterized protein LOC124720341 [Schistocerca piceifrons]XP_047101621.1 uncharacterized protein LOC124720341 [Schistocerca piceifrons]XP_047101622.1 uncharacterized protein LOC124720341 [Schistocerca piceifrons]